MLELISQTSPTYAWSRGITDEQTIYKHNSALDFAPVPTVPKINLKSLMIGDGLTDPYNQFGSVPE
jgi:hypothetical protein